MLNPKGVIIKTSSFTVELTVERLIGLLKSRGVKVYADIDQQKEMNSVGRTIRPMHLIIFGNPQTGSMILPDIPVAGLDLPLKVLIWENNDQVVYMAYNNSGFLKDRYNLKIEISKLLDLDVLVTSVL